MASKAQVPGQFINNWNAADPSKTSRTLHGLSPLPRKPATACEACRLAKAKCTGGEPCGRCSRRNIQCKYKHLADMTNLERQSTTSIPNKDTQHLFSDISVELQSALDGVQALPATFGQWEATFSLTPPEPNLFDSFEPPNETSVQSEKLPQVSRSGSAHLGIPSKEFCFSYGTGQVVGMF